ncbi:MAG: hypothetical protein ACTSR8_05345 [Promethearchaeota archaeon]
MVKEFSIFLENTPGILAQLIKLLNASEINIRAISVAEAENYGLVMILIDKPEECEELLEENEYDFSISDVIVVSLSENSSLLYDIAELMGVNNINIDYMYSTLVEKEANLIIRTNNNHKAINVLKNKGFNVS